MSLRKQAVKSIFWTGLQQFGTQGISFIVSIVLARLLLPEEFGLIGMIGVFIAIGRALVDAGLSQSLIRSKEVTDIGYTTVFYFNLVGSLLVYLLCFLCAPIIANFYDEQILISLLRVFALSIVINAFAAIQLTVLTKELDFKRLFVIQVPSLVVGGVVGVSMAYGGYGVWSLVGSELSRSTARTLQLWYRSSWRPTWEFSKVEFTKHFSYGSRLTLSTLINTIYQNIYPLIIGRYFSAAQLGFYTRANTLKQLPVNNVSAAVNIVTLPLFAKIQDDDERLRRNYRLISQLVVACVGPILAISAGLGEPLFRFLLTEKWLPAVPYYQILCIVGVFYPLNAYNLNVLKVKGRSDLFLRLEILKKTSGIITIFICLPLGIYGLLWASVWLSLFSFFINSYHTGKFINYPTKTQIQDLLPLIFISFVSGLVSYSCDFLLNEQLDIIRLICCSLAGLATFALLVFLFFRSLFHQLIKILKRDQ